MGTWVITGCNRGIGLELARQAKARVENVIGVCRSPSDELRSLDVRIVDGVDVTDAQGVSRLAAALGDTQIDVLINNAGILKRDGLNDLDYDDMLEQFRVNTLGPLRVTSALLDRLGDGSKVAIITSRMGSIDDNTSGGYYGYRVSKAGVNMIGKSLAKDLEDRGIAVALLHPGMVATDMTGRNGIDPEDSARGLIERIDALSMATSGHFWHGPEGNELPW